MKTIDQAAKWKTRWQAKADAFEVQEQTIATQSAEIARLTERVGELERERYELQQKLFASAQYSPTQREGEAIMAEAAAIERAETAEARIATLERELAEARAEYEIEKVHAKGGYDIAARMRKALEEIAQQRLIDELDNDEMLNADVVGGYEACVKTARAALGRTA